MKIRIRKIEYNDGNVEYACEKYKLPKSTIILFVISIMCLIGFFYFFNISKIFCCIYLISSLIFIFTSLIIYKDGWNIISYKIKHSNRNCKSIFNNLDDAKKFFNEELKKEAYYELKNKIKKETIIKYTNNED